MKNNECTINNKYVEVTNDINCYFGMCCGNVVHTW